MNIQMCVQYEIFLNAAIYLFVLLFFIVPNFATLVQKYGSL